MCTLLSYGLLSVHVTCKKLFIFISKPHSVQQPQNFWLYIHTNENKIKVIFRGDIISTSFVYSRTNGMLNLLTSNVNYSGRTAPLTSKVAFYIFIQQIQALNILNMVYILRFFFSSKCSLFHNSNVFGSCIIHILYTGCAKI